MKEENGIRGERNTTPGYIPEIHYFRELPPG
jgi:hypothetical protein